MVKKVSGKDRVAAALQDAADALTKEGAEKNVSSRALRSASRQSSNANSKSNSPNESANNSAAQSPSKRPRNLRTSSRLNSNANSNANSKSNSRNPSNNSSCNQSPSKGVSSPEATLAVPPVLPGNRRPPVAEKTTVVQPALTTREKANLKRDASLAAGDKSTRDTLAREVAARKKAAELKASKAETAKANAKAADEKAVKALEMAAEKKAAKARKKATELKAKNAAGKEVSSSTHVDLSDVSDDAQTSDDHPSDASFAGSDKATAKRKRRLDEGHEDSDSDGELLPRRLNKPNLRGKDVPTRRQHLPVPKRTKPPSTSLSQSNSVPSPAPSQRSNSVPSPATAQQLPPASPAFVQVGAVDTARDAGEKATFFAAVRKAYADIGPSDPPRPPFIYWDPEKVYSCANKVILRTPLLQEMADHYHRRNDFAKKHGQAVRTHANNERSSQIRTMKAMWLNNESHISLVNYNESLVPVTVQLSNDLTHLGKVQDLRAILFSDKMYTFPAVYNLLCSGIESGNFKGISACGISTISELITPAHEAHFRVELWYALPQHGFRHSISTTHAKERMAKWREFLPLVLMDRKTNETQAHQTRLMNATTGVASDDQEDDENDDEAGSQYW